MASDEKVQERLNEAWRSAYTEAEKKFSELTKKYLKNARSKDGKILLQKNTKFEDLQGQVNSVSFSVREDRERHSKWTQPLLNACRPIERFGGAVSGIVSVAFPAAPTGLAFNAISFLITTGHEVSNAYDTLAMLFEEIGQYLTRSSLNSESAMSKHLADNLHRVLIALIIISALSIRLLKQGIITKYFTQAFLGDDREIRAQLNEIKKLTDYETKMVAALSLHDIQCIRRDVEDLFKDFPEFMEDVKDMKIKVDATNTSFNKFVGRDNHRRQLDSMESDLKALENKTVEANRQAFNDIFNSLTDDTALWLYDHEDFKLWLREEKPILVVYGERGTGKSHLAANVFNYLTKRYPQEVQGTSQLSVASHFFNSNKSALRNLRHALQALAFRIAQYDTVYANHFEKSCNSFQQLQQVDDIWEKAFKGFFCSPEYNSRAYVVIDGSDQLTPDDRKLLIRILKDISPTKPQLGDPRFRLQVLICEKRSKDSPIESHLGKDTPILHLDGEINKLDLRAFVTAKVDTHLTWRRWHIRDEIIDAVVSRANGRFDSVDLQIKDLQSKKGKLGVQRALQQPAQDIPAAIRDELQRLSQDLDEVELEEVRKLLTWLIFGRDSYSYNLSNIKDMLAFQQNEDDIEDGSVEELEVQLRDRYNTLFDVERMDDKTTEDLIKAAEDIDSADQPPIATNTTYHIYNSNPQTTYVKVKNSIEDFFLQDQLPGSEVDEVDEAVRAAQMEIVKRFLNLVCDGEMLKRLGFEKVLEQKQEKPKNAIVVDRRKSKIEILGTTLTIITDPDCWTRYSGAGNPFLSEHAVACFADYLSDVSPDSLNADEGGKIIGMLVRILRDEDSIRRWAHDNRRIADNFLDYAPRTADNVASFCETTSFTDQLDIDDQEWIKSILSPDGKVLRHLLWKPLVDVLSHEWLRNTSWEPDLAYDAIQNFLQYQNPKPEVDGEEKKNNMEAASSTETGQNAAPVGAEGNEVDSRQVPLEGSCGPVENDGVLANKGIEQLPGRQEQGGGPISSNAVENVSDDGSDTSEDLPIWKQVIKAAEWTGFDDDALFHVRVGQTLLIYGENDEAITHFQLAKTDDSQGWRAFQGLGKAYFAKGDKNTDALEAQEKGLAAIARFEDDPKPTEDEHAQLLAEFGETLDATNQHNRAVDAYAQALKLNPRRYDLVKRTVESLNELERYSKIMEIFADLESITTEENDGRTRLVDFFIEKCFQDSLHELAHRAARKTGQKNLIRKLYEDCLQTTSKKGLDEERGIFKLWLARFLLRDCLREDEALEHLNEIVRMTSLVSRSYTTRWTRSFAIRDLANAYLGKARAAGPQSTEAQSFIERLNDLTFAPPVDAEDTDVLYALVGNVSLLLGRWNARWALNDAEARRHLKPNILLGVKLLSDDVPYNDIDAYERLGNAFMAYGDDKNAMAAWSALAPQEPVPTDVADPNDQGSPESLTQVDDPPPTGTTATVASTTQLAASTKGSSVDSSLDIDVEASQKEESLPPEILTLPTNPPPAPGTSETPVPEDDKDDAIAGPEMQAPDASSDMEDSPSSRIHFGCDGECGRSWTTGDDVWHCRDALQLDLCDSCYQLMRKGELGFRVCDQYDEWVNVPKYVGPRLQQDTVRYNGQILKLKDWVDLVKKEWEIT